MGKAPDLTGNRYGRFTVVSRAANNKKGNAMWNCICDCGNTRTVLAYHLKSGHSKSCGCITKTHGMFGTRLYKIWDGIKYRCHNSTSDNYNNYGARGITVCEEWRTNFQSFYDWAMSHGYSEDLTIDRIDVNGNYEPDNCRWANEITQHNNTRTNRFITYNGETHTIAEWSRIQNINYYTLVARINRYGWSIEKALTNKSTLK